MIDILTSTKASLSKKYISFIYALWITINLILLRSYFYSGYKWDDCSMFVLYIIVTYSLVTFAYFSWIIWCNRENNHWWRIVIRIMLSAALLYVVITTPYWLKSVYEEWSHWKYCGVNEWIGSNFEVVSVNPAFAKFHQLLLCSYLPSLAISVFIYLRESSREKIPYSIGRVILQTLFIYILYGVMSDGVFFIFGSPCFVLFAMVRCNVITSDKIIRKALYALIIAYVLITVYVSVVFGDTLSQKGCGPVNGYWGIALLGLFINALFYFPILVWSVKVLIKKIAKL